jgi:hypothetical protein
MDSKHLFGLARFEEDAVKAGLYLHIKAALRSLNIALAKFDQARPSTWLASYPSGKPFNAIEDKLFLRFKMGECC